MVLLAGLLAGCEREERVFRPDPSMTEFKEEISLASNSPGEGAPVQYKSGKASRFEKQAFQVSQGKKLYAWFNCNGCHANGGGGSGPALMDDNWIYGSDIENIAASIREGRPNGMPSFRGKVPEEQIWQISAFVRALGGFVRSDVATNRNDDMHAHEPESRLPSPPAHSSSVPGNQMPK
jgi:cytochrome c oxidase cbb3-type subunit 3